jgi:hypothetical protein
MTLHFNEMSSTIENYSIVDVYDRHGSKKGEYLVSSCDYALVSAMRFGLNSRGYVESGKRLGLGLLHRIICTLNDVNFVVDHINRIKNDNRRENLRPTNQSLNMHNKSLKSRTGLYRGVSWVSSIKKYRVHLNGKSYGSYDDKIYAANVYNYYAILCYGDQACLNDVPKMDVQPYVSNRQPDREPGVLFSEKRNRWIVRIQRSKKVHNLGDYMTKEMANTASREFREKEKRSNEESLLSVPITRNSDDIAVIKVKGYNKTSCVEVLVDDDKWHILMRSTWSVSNYGYAKSKNLSMHQIVFGKIEKGNVIDHINRNKLDNRTNNLREATPGMNAQNKRTNRDGSDLPIGVTSLKNSKFYEARINFNHKGYYIGIYDSSEKAAKQYDKAALYLYGDGAKINYETEDYNLSDLKSSGLIIPPAPKDHYRFSNDERCTYLDKRFSKYFVRIKIDGKEVNLRYFDTRHEAINARKNLELKHDICLKGKRFELLANGSIEITNIPWNTNLK